MSNTSRILLVDDVPMFRELGQVFLSRSGPVDLADSGAAAFKHAESRPPSIVIADMHLPDVEGAELCRRFKTHPDWGHPRIVLLARPDSPEDHAEAVRAGADDVLFKPLERDALINAVRRLVDFETPRGLPRAAISERVAITTRGQQIEGRLRNVSRGGVFVDTGFRMQPAEEVSLSFSLDGNGSVVAPTARVVWAESGADGVDHFGLRFLEIDAQTVERIDHYVSDHFPRTPSLPA
ncbi:MAG: response regulator [Myxococcota bacterium]